LSFPLVCCCLFMLLRCVRGPLTVVRHKRSFCWTLSGKNGVVMGELETYDENYIIGFEEKESNLLRTKT
jgi:hypothetical protein